MVTALLHKIASESRETVPSTDVRLAFVRFRYMVTVCMLVIRSVCLENGFMKEPVKYETSRQKVFRTDIFISSGQRKSLFASF